MKIQRVAPVRAMADDFAALGLSWAAARWVDDEALVIERKTLNALAKGVTRTYGALCARAMADAAGEAPRPASAEPLFLARIDFDLSGGHPELAALEVNPVLETVICAVMQWQWIERAMAEKSVPSRADQLNRLNDALAEGIARLRPGEILHVPFDAAEPASAALAGYLYGLGKTVDREVRPVPAGLLRPGEDGRLRDPEGLTVERHYTALSEKGGSLPIDCLRPVEPWTRRMAALAPVGEPNAETPTLSAWVLNGRLEALSAARGSGGAARWMPHFVIP